MGRLLDEVFPVASQAGMATLPRQDGRRLTVECRQPMIEGAHEVHGVVVAFHDRTEQQRSAAAEHSGGADQRLELALRGSKVTIWDFAVGGPIGEWSGPYHPDRWHADDRAAVNESLQRCLSGASDELQIESRLRQCDGTYRWHLNRAVVLRDGQGGPARFIGASVDISDRKALEEDLRRAKENAEASNRAKDDFLANVSHEIRTPMNAILGLIDLLLEDASTHEQIQALTTVKSAGEALLAIIEDLLDVSKIQAGKVTLESKEWSVRSTLAETLQSLALRAHRKGLELVANVEPDVPAAVMGDALRVRQILTNLIGNAIKFTTTGEVEVNVSSDTAPGVPDRCVELRFAVADSGIGIPRHKHAIIFEAFEQEDSSTTRKYGGTGLGLTIATRLAALMEGGITVDSEPGRGSTFTFAGRFACASSSQRPRRRLDGVRILVVDDNATTRRILARWLQGWGAEPATAFDGQQARHLLEQAAGAGRPFRLALVDGQMPELQALAVSAQAPVVRKLASLQTILLLSGDSPSEPEWTRQLGVHTRLQKPIEQDALYETIVHALRGERRVRAQRQLDGPTAGVPLRILVAEDQEFNSQLLEKLLAKRGHHMLLATDGYEALATVEAGGIDLVLLDLHMPGLDGIQVIKAIRDRERMTGSRVPVIALTARARTEDREQCLAAGMDEFLTKPIRAEDLWASLDRVAARFRRDPK